MIPTYIIDGYNLIHKIPEFRSVLHESLEHAREKLEQKLIGFLSTNNAKFILVYDGVRMPAQQRQRKVHHLKIIFSKNPQDADSIIKKLISQNSNHKNVYVVSADLDLVNEARAFHANSLSPVDFINRMQVMKKESFEIRQKYNHTMSKKELAEWLKLFDSEPDESGDNREA